MRVFGIYHLLCDHCNLLFTGFMLPGTLAGHRRGKHKQAKKSVKERDVAASSPPDLS
jgi:hypothetical protein